MLLTAKSYLNSILHFIQDLGPFPILLACLVLMSLLGTLLKRPKIKGILGELAVNRMLRKELNPEQYRLLHNLLLPDGKGGQTQIDHVVVSAYGIFVIETKNWECWIFGDEKGPHWTLTYPRGGKRKTLNPLHQNEGHVKAVCSLLDVKREHCHNLVCINEVSTLKTGPIQGVFLRGMPDYIRSFQGVVFEPSWVQFGVAQLLAASKSKDKNSVAAHLEQVQAKQRYA